MLRLLVLFGISFYLVLIVYGDDRGQLRAGLRDAPTSPASPPPIPAPAKLAVAAPDAPGIAAPPGPDAIPHQALRILPPSDQPIPASLTEAAAAQTVLQTASIPVDLPADPAPAANITLRWVAVDSANVRAQPGRNGAIEGRVARGEAVQVLWSEPSGWVRIRVQGDGVDGFVFGNLLTDIDPGLDLGTN